MNTTTATAAPQTAGNEYDQQAEQFMTATSTSFKAKFWKNARHFDDDKVSRDIYKVTLKTLLGQYTFDFGQSQNNSDGNTPPRPYDVFACVQKYDVGSFEDFCSEFGYDTDSRKAERTYKAVCREYENISRIYTKEQLTLMQRLINL